VPPAQRRRVVLDTNVVFSGIRMTINFCPQPSQAERIFSSPATTICSTLLLTLD
jgi:hypothetical protein